MLAPVAARLVPEGRAGRATATVFVGNSLALVAGIPAGSAVGQLLGWRVAMGLMAVAAAAVAVTLAAVLPSLPQPPGGRRAPTVELLGDRALLRLCAATAVAVVGDFIAYTYITELVRADGGLVGLGTSAALLAYGSAGVVGVAVLGRAVDRGPRRASAACLLGLVVAMGALAVLPPGSTTGTVAAVVVWGAAFTALPAALQTVVLRIAPDDAERASSLYVVAFQIGIGGGALLGAPILSAGHIRVLPALGAVLALAATGLLAAGRLRSRPADPAARS